MRRLPTAGGVFDCSSSEHTGLATRIRDQSSSRTLSSVGPSIPSPFVEPRSGRRKAALSHRRQLPPGHVRDTDEIGFFQLFGRLDPLFTGDEGTSSARAPPAITANVVHATNIAARKCNFIPLQKHPNLEMRHHCVAGSDLVAALSSSSTDQRSCACASPSLVREKTCALHGGSSR